MKRYIILAIILCCAGLYCSDESELPCKPPTLKIVNSTSYEISKVYLHETPIFNASTATLFGPQPFNPGTEIDVPISDGYTTYCTFIRKITSTSDTDIAVTTSRPVECYACFAYTLHLLDEDFYLEEK